MTESEIKEFIEYFGDKLPDPTHQPLQFEWYVTLWELYNDRSDRQLPT